MLGSHGGSKMDMVVKLVLIFCISLLSFSVGTFIGKQASDSDYRRASVEGDEQSLREVASLNDDLSQYEEGHTLTEEDIAQLSEDFVKTEKKSSKKAKKRTCKLKRAPPKKQTQQLQKSPPRPPIRPPQPTKVKTATVNLLVLCQQNNTEKNKLKKIVPLLSTDKS